MVAGYTFKLAASHNFTQALTFSEAPAAAWEGRPRGIPRYRPRSQRGGRLADVTPDCPTEPATMPSPQGSHRQTAGSAARLELVFCSNYRDNVSNMSERQELPSQ
jgi:hypothetical protein